MSSTIARALLAVLALAPGVPALACEALPPAPAHLGGGAYCLESDLRLHGTASPIYLEDDATLDCQGHRIVDLDSSISFGVIAKGDNIALKDCVFDGFDVAVFFDGATHYRIVGNAFVDARAVAIFTIGAEGFISRNVVSNPRVEHKYFTAMNVTGSADIIGNAVTGNEASDNGSSSEQRSGILSYENDGGLVAANVVRNTPGGRGWAMLAGGHSIVYGNVLVSAPGRGDVGINCYQWTGVSLENVVIGHPRPYNGCPTDDESLRSGGPRR